jgi:hypothetical protein
MVAMPVSIHNEIEIAVTAEDLFNYVTQPWLWHEWHPNSKSARAAHSFLATGDEFDEIIEVQLLPPLPLRMTRRTAYTVTESVPFQTWETEGRMKDGWVRIRYDFEEKGGVTFFSRTLDFDVNGLNRVLLPLLKLKMEKLSMVALNNLKSRMQARADES